jgi:hypothetical protein
VRGSARRSAILRIQESGHAGFNTSVGVSRVSAWFYGEFYHCLIEVTEDSDSLVASRLGWRPSRLLTHQSPAQDLPPSNSLPPLSLHLTHRRKNAVVEAQDGMALDKAQKNSSDRRRTEIGRRKARP